MSRSNQPEPVTAFERSPLLGIIGGISYHSTAIYYQKINEGFAQLFGQERSAPLLIYSHDFGLIVEAQRRGDWQAVRQSIVASAKILAASGCQAILIASNTIHKLSKVIKQGSGLPIIHIADAVGQRVHHRQQRRLGLLGTRPTMEEAFYRDRLQSRWGLEVVVPARDQRQLIHDIIFQDLVFGILGTARQKKLMAWCQDWCYEQNLDTVVFACTELNMLLNEFRVSFAVIDSLEAHIQAALDFFEKRSSVVGLIS